MFLYVDEFKGAGEGGAPQAPALASQRLDVKLGKASVSLAFRGETKLVRLTATENCCVAFGTDPEADPAKSFMPAGRTLDFGVWPGQRVSVIAAEEF